MYVVLKTIVYNYAYAYLYSVLDCAYSFLYDLNVFIFLLRLAY